MNQEFGKHRARRNGCRHGHHQLGEGTPVGGGIMRRTCELCGAVTIDLTEAAPPERTSLFVGRRSSLPAKARAEVRPAG